MTVAIALYVTRSLALGFWLVEHLVQSRRARQRGDTGLTRWLFPVLSNWHAGDRLGPLLWCVAVVVYAVAAVLSARV